MMINQNWSHDNTCSPATSASISKDRSYEQINKEKQSCELVHFLETVAVLEIEAKF